MDLIVDAACWLGWVLGWRAGICLLPTGHHRGTICLVWNEREH